MKLNILLAEDSPLNQRLMKKLIQKWDYHLTIAVNGLEVMKHIQNEKYDIILMDIQMPEMDGYAAAQEIRNLPDPALRNIPIIALTAHASNDEAEKCLGIGMNAYISKPFEPDFLNETIIRLTTHTALKENTELKNTVSEGRELYDLDYLREHADGDADFLEEMIVIFLTDTPPLLQQLNKDIDERDHKKIRVTSHSMKGLFLTLGINNAANWLREIEAMAEEGKAIEMIRSNFEKILAVFNQCKLPLKEELNKIRGNSTIL